ncbi:hypothetical protein FQZ97_870050 [compost metagenome]
MPLDVILRDRQHRHDDQIPDGRNHQQRDHFKIAAVDDLHRVEEFRQRKHVDHRCAFSETDNLIEARRKDRAHGLRKHDAEGLPASWQTKRGGGFELTLIDRQNTATDDLG